MTRFSLVGLLGVIVIGMVVWAMAGRGMGRKLPFTLGMETTGIDRPLTKDGRPDYVRAMNEKHGRGVSTSLFGTPDDLPPAPDMSRRTRETEERYTERIATEISQHLIGGFEEALRNAVYQHHVSVMRDRMLRALVGAAWYKAENGQWPAKLSHAAPKYLKQVPEDVFSPGDEVGYMRTKKEGGGASVYSIIDARSIRRFEGVGAE
ncbi:MAG: hypothetical protein FWD53_04810 [Phycisphaerales bacterium]|nr:hypothetical protein [Phycisphaerales bacterium]